MMRAIESSHRYSLGELRNITSLSKRRTIAAISLLLLVSLCCSQQLEAARHRVSHARRAVTKNTAKEQLTIVVDGKTRKKVELFRINSLQYCSFDALKLSAIKAKRQVASDVVISRHKIVTKGSSFFVLAEAKLQTKMAQMTLPCITANNQVCVPYPSFFDALATLGLCTIDETEKTVRWVEAPRPVAKAIDDDFSIPAIDGPEKVASEKPINTKTSSEDNLKVETKTKSRQKGTVITPDEVVPSKSPVQTQPQVPSQPQIQSAPAPFRYQLPRDLRRRELEDSTRDSPSGFLFDPSSESEPLLASLSFFELAKRPARINRIEAKVEKKATLIHFYADRDLPEVDQPEFSDAVIHLRIKDAVNAVPKLEAIRKLNVRSARSYLEDGEQVFEICLKSPDRTVELQRLSDRHLLLRIVNSPAPKAPVASHRSRWNLDVIVIDAGHGGKDAGAESVHSKNEKDITLGIALRLRDEIKKKLPKTKVVLTRSNDTFIELYRRGAIANEAKGKLFISIHCNSTPTKPSNASGFETYVLSPAKTNTAIDVAQRENSVIHLESNSDRYKGLDDDQLIVATLAQNSFVKLSTRFASMVQKNLAASTTMPARSVNQAGFIVLIGASMPAVLIETGFVSNSSDEKILCSAKGQQSIAHGIGNAVLEYSKAYDRMLKD